MPRPSIVPIALTLDDRTGYTLWAPPWEEDGEEWQAFLGTTEDDPETGGRAVVHLFPSPAALAAFCRRAADHDLADHPVWPVVATLDATDLTPDADHRYDLDGVYDIAAENPDRWAVEELAATIDMVGRLAECLDLADDDDGDDGGSGGAGIEATDIDEVDADADENGADENDGDENDGDGTDADTEFEAIAELVSRPEVGSLGLGPEAFVGRSGEESWVRLGGALDELWEDVVEELGEHLDWTGAGTARLEDYPSATEEAADEDTDEDTEAHPDENTEAHPDEDATGNGADASGRAGTADRLASVAAGGSTGATAGSTAGVSTIRGGSRVSATPEAVAAAAEFWEGVGILPVEVVVAEGAGVTLRCYVEDQARFLGRDGEIYVFPTPTALARFCARDERHDLVQIASWPEVADTDTMPLPAEQDRYDLTELAEVLAEVADGAGGLVEYRVLLQPVEGARDIAEYAGLVRVEELLAAGTPLGRALARADREPGAPLTAEDAAALRPLWAEVVQAVGGVLAFRS